MQKFTEAYTKAKDVVDNQTFAADWQTFLHENCGVKKFIAKDGFDTAYAKSPELIRGKIKKLTVPKVTTSGEVIYKAATNDKSTGTLEERAATIKMLEHVHRIHQRGGQNVWVYSPPKMDTKWVFDELQGNAATVKARLNREVEIFTNTQMKWMSSALKISRKIAEETKSKLAGGALAKVKASTKEIVKKWFLDEDGTDAQLEEALGKLLAGFKNIAAKCNSNTLVFTDYPDWKSMRDKYFGAAFRGGEGGGFPVIYLEGAFTRLTGNSGKIWLCAETIIHEMSHHEVSTQDHRYDSSGLKPNKSTFPYAKAIDNADSWGYFAIDLAGYLSKADSNNVCK
jgi:hypothetical protein